MDAFIQNIIEAAVKKPRKKARPQEMEEVVDEDGNVMDSAIPPDYQVKTVTAKKTTDDTVKMARQRMDYGVNGSGYRRYWGESDMSATLGYEQTLGKDKSYEEAKAYFMNDLGFEEREAEDRLEALGYEKSKAEKDKVRLVEKQYLSSLVDRAMAPKPNPKINPIIRRQLHSLKETLKANGLSLNDVIQYLQDGQ
jgi:hypothetical protein